MEFNCHFLVLNSRFLVMDPRLCAQDVLRCDQCESPSVESHCDTCQSRLCNDCVTRGRCSDSSLPHQVVPLRERITVPRYPKCSQHADKHCQLHCQKCDTAVCSTCISTGTHLSHPIVDILNKDAGQLGATAASPNTADKEKQSSLQSELSMETSEAESVVPVKHLLDKPRVTYKYRASISCVYGVACFGDDIWTFGDDKTISRFNSRARERTMTITTKCKTCPCDITVTKKGYLVFTDVHERTVNIVKKKKIEKLIKFKKWLPRYVCSTSADDLLVVMDHAEYNTEPTKVVRYCGSTEKQAIQVDDRGKPLYSSGGYHRFIAENGNLDICVSDNCYDFACVTVVDQFGKFRFRYKGHLLTDKKRFNPRGIDTDSQNRILVACADNLNIHILNKNGQFLGYIDNCDLQWLHGLYVDSRDYLYVTEYLNGIVKKIQYTS